MPSCGASNDERGACVIPVSFQSIHAHGLVRIAAATPKASTGDVQANVDATLDLARLASDKGADLVLFPELNISSYAIDDLHLQDAMLSAVETGIERIVAESARSEEHTSELQSLMRISYAVFCLQTKTTKTKHTNSTTATD